MFHTLVVLDVHLVRGVVVRVLAAGPAERERVHLRAVAHVVHAVVANRDVVDAELRAGRAGVGVDRIVELVVLDQHVEHSVMSIACERKRLKSLCCTWTSARARRRA